MKYTLLACYFLLISAPAVFAQTAMSTLEAQKVELFEQKTMTKILSDYDYLRPEPNPRNIISLLKNSKFLQLSDDAQEDLLLSIADNFRGHLQKNNPELKTIFTSKLNKFILNYLKKELGLAHKKLSDLTVSVNTNRLNVYRITSEPNTNNSNILNVFKYADYGFEVDLMRSIQLDKITAPTSFNFEWKNSSGDIKAQLQLSPRNAADTKIIHQIKSPNYQKLLRDGIYKGVVLIGSNMKKDANALVATYIQYYLKENFIFVNHLRNIHTLSYLKNNTYGSTNSTETMDFLAKEAHSSGDEKYIFRVSDYSYVYRAEKINTEGIKEVIEIVAPEAESTHSIAVSNNEFAQWMKQRESRVGDELIYLNGSCWSLVKALFEVAAVHSPLFINIPSKTVSYTFNHITKNGTYYLFDGIQKRQSFSEIREHLSMFESYRQKKYDYYIFPDESTYQREFHRFGLNNYIFEIKMQKKTGPDYIDYSIESDEL